MRTPGSGYRITEFDDYKDAFSTITLERDEQGILLLTCDWNVPNTREWIRDIRNALFQIGEDPENRVLIIAGKEDEIPGMGRSFHGIVRNEESVERGLHETTGRPVVWPEKPFDTVAEMPDFWEIIHSLGRGWDALLDLGIPLIAAVSGSLTSHPEYALLGDIVLCSDDAKFQDGAHVGQGFPPGDGVNIIWPLLLGMNRGRYFLWTNQVIDAQQALDWGVVNEVLPSDQLLDRAYELARLICRESPFVVSLSKKILTHQLKMMVHANFEHGLALEGLAFPGYLDKMWKRSPKSPATDQ